MNPLPNRPLLNNPALPLSLPNVPPFDQMAYNGRPRKVMPETGKDFPILNGISLMSGLSTAAAPSTGQIPPLERNNALGSGMIQNQQQSSNQLIPQLQQQSSGLSQQLDRDKDGDSEPRQLTAIFRPDDAGEWKEKLRQSHEVSEQARLASSWDRRPRYDDDDVKDEDGEVEDEESSVVGEGEGAKVWKAKRTLRKSVV
jgi:striatin 1/3/4